MRQSDFRAALLDPRAAIPAGLVAPGTVGAALRFAVHRNNVAAGLTAALETGFPVLRRLLGEDFFAAMAGRFLRQHPPRSPVLASFGAEMPAFLQGMSALRHLPYLPDIARLEIALRAAYHAADAVALSADALRLPPERLMPCRLHLAPALRLLRSVHPVHAIWQSQTIPGSPPPQTEGAQDIVVLRPLFDPAPHLLPKGGADFIAALASGASIATAADCAGPDHDLPATLSILVGGGAFCGLETAG